MQFFTHRLYAPLLPAGGEGGVKSRLHYNHPETNMVVSPLRFEP